MDSEFNDLEKVEELCNNAFPVDERFMTVDEGIRRAQEQGGVELTAVYDEDVPVEFYVLTVTVDYKYIQFIAVNPNIRRKDYGGRILKKLLEENKDGILFAPIENPVQGRIMKQRSGGSSSTRETE